jgi:hypothetical protein
MWPQNAVLVPKFERPHEGYTLADDGSHTERWYLVEPEHTLQPRHSLPSHNGDRLPEALAHSTNRNSRATRLFTCSVFTDTSVFPLSFLYDFPCIILA